MKKIMFFLILILFAIIPFKIKGASKEGKIDTTSALTNNTQTKVGEYFTISFSVWFWGLQKNTYDTYGVGAVGFTIQLDDNDFLISSTSSNKWDTSTYDLGNGKYYFVSEYIENSDSDNACIEKELYCSSYTIDVKFFVKNTNKKNSSIIMTSANAGFIDLSKDYSTITEDDVIMSSYNNIRTVIMTIQQQTSEDNYQEPKTIAEKSNGVSSIKSNTQIKDIDINRNKLTNSNLNNDNSNGITANNNSLKSLEIEGYNINFSKSRNDYVIDIKKDVNSLKVKAVAEDEKANIEIIGADDLKANNQKVIINVKAENGNINTYTINTNVNNKKSIQEKNNKKMKFNKKQIIIGSIILGSIIIVVIIVFIIIHIHDKKIDKAFDTF